MVARVNQHHILALIQGGPAHSQHGMEHSQGGSEYHQGGLEYRQGDKKIDSQNDEKWTKFSFPFPPGPPKPMVLSSFFIHFLPSLTQLNRLGEEKKGFGRATRYI